MMTLRLSFSGPWLWDARQVTKLTVTTAIKLRIGPNFIPAPQNLEACHCKAYLRVSANLSPPIFRWQRLR
jgi:hypothetical protein